MGKIEYKSNKRKTSAAEWVGVVIIEGFIFTLGSFIIYEIYDNSVTDPTNSPLVGWLMISILAVVFIFLGIVAGVSLFRD